MGIEPLGTVLASPTTLTAPKYRADIDGLRAFAVLAVVFFHAFPGKFSGGFIGVDVFFVISGFLISTIIFENLAKGSFSFAEFYTRRIKRIFPALLLVLFSCLVFGWFVLLGNEYKQLAKHIVAGTGFVSNFVLWNESGYFDNEAATKPLLHLWSLGIEEQFYIFWPLLVYFVWRKNLSLGLIICSVLIFSFMLNIYGIYNDSVATFYSPLTRFWELSVGSLLAYISIHKPNNFSVLQSNLLASIGAICLFAAIFVTKQDDSFPGWWALLPVIGALLIITAGPEAYFNRKVLSNKIAVWFGLISFPLYLWHWPILSFGRIIEGGIPGRSFKILALLAAVLLAWLTYRLIERRIRFSVGSKFIKVLFAAMVIISASGAFVYFNNGVADLRMSNKIILAAEINRQLIGPSWPYSQNDICMQQYPYKNLAKLAWWFCMKSDPGPTSIILLGNSLANQLYPGFINNRLLKQHTVLSIGTCGIAGSERDTVDSNNPCYRNKATDQAEFIDSLITQTKSIRFAIIDGIGDILDPVYIENLRKRISFLESKGIQVIVFTPSIRPGFDPRTCFPSPATKRVKDCTFPVTVRTEVLDHFKPLINVIAASNPKVKFFEQNQMFCSKNSCSFVLNGLPLNRDAVHMSEYGSITLQNYFTAWAKENVPEIFAAG